VSQTIHYNEYRQRLSGRIEQLVTPNLKKILIFGDKFEDLEEKWKKEGKKITRLETLKEDWFDINREKPEFDLAVEKQSFDLLIGYHGLERALDPERLLLELRKYLVKEGLFIPIAYNVGHISTIVNLLTEGWAHKHDGALREGHIRYFSYESLKELLKLSGFDLIGEDVYGMPEMPELTNQLVKLTRNPYLNALSFIFRGKRVETFPFIEGTYP
jgi:hypothetical protein